MPGEVLGHGRIIVEVDDPNVRRDLARIEQDYTRTMRKLSREEAALKVNSDEFKAKLKQAQAEAEKWDKAKYTATLDADEKGLKKANAELDKANKKVDSLTKKNTKAQRAYLSNLDQQAKAEIRRDRAREDSAIRVAAARAKAELAADKLIDAAHLENWKRENTRINNLQKAHDAAIKEEIRRNKSAATSYNNEWDAAIKQNMKMDKARAKSESDSWDSAIKEDIKRTQRAADKYNKTWDNAIKEDMRRRARAELSMSQAHDAAIKEGIRRDQKAVDAYNKNWDSALAEDRRRTGERERMMAQANGLEAQFAKLYRQRQGLTKVSDKVFAGRQVKYDAKLETAHIDEQLLMLEAKLKAVERDPVKIRAELDTHSMAHPGEGFGRFASAIKDTTVRLGPFTTTIAGLGRALALLGPIISGLVGSLGALVGSLGSGIVGAAGAATAGLGAFGLVLGSTALLLPSLMKDFKNLNTLQKAYHLQVLKTGANSAKAQTKLEELNHAIKAAGPGARAAFEGYQGLGKAVNNLSKQARPAFFKDLAVTFKGARSSLKEFGPDIIKSFDLVSTGWRAMIKGLTSNSADKIFHQLFAAGLNALPAFGRGLGNLAHAAGNVAVAFSKMLGGGKGLGAGFESWTQKILKFTNHSDKMKAFVEKTTNSMRTFGHVLQSATRFLGTFFGAAAGPGDKLFMDMARGMDHWTSSIQKNKAQNLTKFFRDSIDTTTKLYKAIKPIGQVFMEWVTIMRPISNIMLSIAKVVTTLIDDFAKFGATKVLLQAAFGIFLVGSLVSKIGVVTKGIIALKNAIIGMRAAGLAGKFTSAITGGGSTAIADFAAFATGRRRAVTEAVAGATAVEAAGSKLNTALRGSEVAAASAGAGLAGLGRGAKVAEEGLAGVATKAAPAATGLAGTLGMVGRFGPAALIAGAGIASFALTFDLLKHHVDASTEALKRGQAQYKATVNAANRSNAALIPQGQAVAGAAIGVAQGRLDVKAAQKEVNRLMAAGKTKTDAYRQAVINLSSAQLSESQSVKELRDGYKKQQAILETGIKRSRQAGTVARQTFEKIGKETVIDWHTSKVEPLLTMFSDLQNAALKANVPIRDLIKNAKIPDDQRTKLLNMATAYDTITKSGKEYDKELALSALNTANLQRELKMMSPIARSAAGAFQSIITKARTFRQAGKIFSGSAITAKISTQYAAPKDAARVAQTASKALQSGVSSKLVYTIIANTRDADSAIARLSSTNIPYKTMKIIEKGGKEAVAALEKIIGRKIPEKLANIITKGGPAALALASNIKTAFNAIPNVHASVNVINNATPILTSIKTILDNLRNKDIYVTTHYQHVGVGPALGARFRGGPFAGFASGGRTDEHVMLDAFRQASMQSPTAAKSGAYKKPTLLVGEERRTEYVIATNPAYRERNIRYLAQAAQEMGMQVIPGLQGVIAAAKGKASSKPKKNTDPKIHDPKVPVKHTRDKKLGPGKNAEAAKDVKGPRKLPLTKPFTAGGIPLDQAQKPLTDINSEIKTRESRIESLEKIIRREKTALPKMHPSRGESHKAFANAVDRAKATIEKNETELDYLKFGELAKNKKGKPQQIAPSLSTLKTEQKRLQERYNKVKKINDDIEEQKSQVNRFTSYMNADSTKYARTGDQKFVDDWNERKTKRDIALGKLHDLYQNAAAAAKPGTPWERQMQEALADIIDQQATSDSTASPSENAISLDDFITRLGIADKAHGQAQLQNLLRDQAYAEYFTPTVDDVASTPIVTDAAGNYVSGDEHRDSLIDDLKAAQALETFYTDIYKTYKDKMPVQTQTELLNAITSSHQSVTDLGTEISAGVTAAANAPDAAQVRDTARYAAIQQYGSNVGSIRYNSDPGTSTSPGYSSPSPTSLSDPIKASTSFTSAPGGSSGVTSFSSAAPEAASTLGSANIVARTVNIADKASSGSPNISAPQSAGLRSSGGSYSPGAAASTHKTNNVTINNSFPTPPPAPHAWSNGVGFELGGIL